MNIGGKKNIQHKYDAVVVQLDCVECENDPICGNN